MGFHVLAKHGLNKHGLKDPNLVSFWDNQKSRNEESKKRRGGDQAKGMELLTLSMDPWFCLVNGLPQT